MDNNIRLAKLVETGERWYIEYNFRDEVTGNFHRPPYRVYVSTKLKLKKERREWAKQKIAEINKELKKKRFVQKKIEKDVLTLKQGMLLVLYYKKASLRKDSYNTYKDIVNTFLKFLKQKKYTYLLCHKFDEKKARDFMDYAKTVCEYSNRTYNNYLKAMRTFFKELQKRKYIKDNPFADIDKLEVEETEIICFNRHELNVIKNTLPKYNQGLYLASQLLFYAYLRPKETTRLRVENIDLKNRIIRVPGKASKNKKTQTVVIPNQLYKILKDFELDKYPPHYRLISKHLMPGEKQVSPKRISEAWREYANEHKLDRRKTFYHLKHTSVGLAVENGINVRDLQLQLRHTSLETTQIYIEKFNNMASEYVKNNFPTF